MSRVAVFKSFLAAGVLALGMSAASHAATVTFDFTNLSGNAKKVLTFSQGGLDLTVTADHFRAATKTLLGGGRVTRGAMGLGEQTGRESLTEAAVEGQGPKEILFFDFSKKVLLKSVTFADIATGSRISVFLDSNWWRNRLLTGSTVDLSSAAQAVDRFGIGAATRQSSFRIASITVTAIPVPATGLLLLGSLTLLPFLRRKRSA